MKNEGYERVHDEDVEVEETENTSLVMKSDDEEEVEVVEETTEITEEQQKGSSEPVAESGNEEGEVPQASGSEDKPPGYDAVSNEELPAYDDVVKDDEEADLAGLESGEGVWVYEGARYTAQELSTLVVGTDSIFFLCFMLAFLFNWFGYIAAYFFSNTIAGKCGATAGLGIDMIKWGFLLRYGQVLDGSGSDADGGNSSTTTPPQNSTDTDPGDLHSPSNWFASLLVVIGWFIFFRGVAVYVRIRQQMAAQL
eukprot:Clim_evm42s33 gene=Clim_evmTU42s33